MQPTSIAFLFVGLIFINSCQDCRRNHSKQATEESHSQELSQKSDDELRGKLIHLKFLQSESQEVSKTPFVGPRSKLDNLIKDLRSIDSDDHYKHTWVLDSKTGDTLNGTLLMEAQPKFHAELNDIITKLENELRRRENKALEK